MHACGGARATDGVMADAARKYAGRCYGNCPLHPVIIVLMIRSGALGYGKGQRSTQAPRRGDPLNPSGIMKRRVLLLPCASTSAASL